MFSSNVTSPIGPTEAEWDQLVQSAVAAVTATEARTADLNANQRGRSWHLGAPRDPLRPVWTSRRGWITQVGAVLRSEAGLTTCRRHRIAAEKVLQTTVSMASCADNAGGGVTKSVRTLAEDASASPTAVERSRRVLRDLDLAYEIARGRLLRTEEFHAARAHHGGYQTRAASTWACSSPAYAVELVAASQPKKAPIRRRTRTTRRRACDGLSLDTPVRELSLVGKNSPTRIRETRKRDLPATKTQPRIRALHAQRAAAAIAARIGVLRMGHRWPGTRARHIGSVVDVLINTGIDTNRWDGDAICNRLNADSIARGWTTPQQLHNPIGWLRSRLARLDWTGPTPRELAAEDTRRRQAEAAARRAEIDEARKRAAGPDSAARRNAVRNWRSFKDSSDTTTAAELQLTA